MPIIRRLLSSASIVALSIGLGYSILSVVGCSRNADSPDSANDSSASSSEADGNEAEKNANDLNKGQASGELPDSSTREHLESLALGFGVDLDAEPDPLLQGSWKLARVYERLEGGSQEYLEVSSKYEMTIEGRHVTVVAEFAEGEETQQHQIYVGRQQELSTYILYRTDVEYADETQIGIYQISDGHLHFCFQETGGFPEAFVVPGGGDRLMFEFERNE